MELPLKSPGYGALSPVKTPFDAEGAACLALGVVRLELLGLPLGGNDLPGFNSEPVSERRRRKMRSDVVGMVSTVSTRGPLWAELGAYLAVMAHNRT